jgi:hypothetical protein
MTEIWENISKLFLSETTELFKNKLGWIVPMKVICQMYVLCVDQDGCHHGHCYKMTAYNLIIHALFWFQEVWEYLFILFSYRVIC